MNPMLKSGVSLGTFRTEESDALQYYAMNAAGDFFVISYSVYHALMQADGTRPLQLHDEGRELLPRLKQYGLVHTSRLVMDGDGTNRFILFQIGSSIEKYKPAFARLTRLLPFAAIVVFVLGLICALVREKPPAYPLNIVALIGFVILSIGLHEFGHFSAGITFGFDISDVGILLVWLIPIGAYISCEIKSNAFKNEKIRFALAGIEMNLLLAGLFLLLSGLFASLYSSFVWVAILNVVFAFVNLLPTKGLDGERALSAFLELESVSDTARYCLRSRMHRKRMLHAGLNGFLCFVILSLSRLSGLVLSILLVGDVIVLVCCLVQSFL